MDKNSNPPLNVTIQAVFVLFITSWNGIRVYSALANWQILREFGANPAYIFGTGLFWMLVSLWLFREIWEARRLAVRAGLASAGLYFLWYWYDRLAVQPAPAPNTLFSMVVSILLLVIFTINLVMPVSKAFFKKE
jgi:hypothetical protein